MPLSIVGPDADETSREELIEVSDLQAAIRIATRRAFQIMEADLAAGQLKPDGSISIRDDSGRTVHVVRFSDLVGDIGQRSH